MNPCCSCLLSTSIPVQTQGPRRNLNIRTVFGALEPNHFLFLSGQNTFKHMPIKDIQTCVVSCSIPFPRWQNKPTSWVSLLCQLPASQTGNFYHPWHRPMIVQKLLFRCSASAISCGKRPKKTSALLWFATLTGVCAAKPDERTKWPFLFTA